MMLHVLVDANPAPRRAHGLVSLPLYGGVRNTDLSTGDVHAIVDGTEWLPYSGKLLFVDGVWYLFTHARMLTRPTQFLDEYGAILMEFRAANTLPL